MTAKVGSFRVATQFEKWGYFGEVAVSITTRPVGVVVRFDPSCSTPFDDAIRFGIGLAYEKCPKLPFGCDVVVTAVKSFPVDSTHSIMAYVAARAFFAAVEVPVPTTLALNVTDGTVTFPR